MSAALGLDLCLRLQPVPNSLAECFENKVYMGILATLMAY
jgi:hypothetical protein